MSIFIDACMASLGFRLMPPESYITPLPTRARCPVGRDGRYDSLIMRGGSVLPALTPRIPPQPSSRRASASNTSTLSFEAAPTAMATSAIRVAVRCPGGVLARSRASWAALATTRPRSAPRSTAAVRGAVTTSAARAARRPASPASARRSGSGPGGHPSTTAWAATSAGTPGATSASVVASAPCLAAARANAAAASRNAAGVRSAVSPTPTAISVAPSRRGTTNVWPTLASNPDSASVARSRPSWRGTGPLVPTGTPTTSAVDGTDRPTDTTTSCDARWRGSG